MGKQRIFKLCDYFNNKMEEENGHGYLGMSIDLMMLPVEDVVEYLQSRKYDVDSVFESFMSNLLNGNIDLNKLRNSDIMVWSIEYDGYIKDYIKEKDFVEYVESEVLVEPYIDTEEYKDYIDSFWDDYR